MADINGLWIFGYGSLCWNPGFEFNRSITGCIKGFERKFWQGNATHRGTKEKPGRVVTLVENKQEITYGRAFEVKGDAALPYLNNRECKLGGYLTTITTFYSRDKKLSFPVVIYIATNDNEHWLGDAPLKDIAEQIFNSKGPSGHNVEYLLRLANFMHRCIPEAYDDHLFTLETLVRSKIKSNNLCLHTLMGHREFSIELESSDLEIGESNDDDDDNNFNGNNEAPVNSFQYTSRIPVKTLRCLKP
ncbi:putative glutathione-specific gamma-glutamylcyclotransferase 2 [Microplitis mediator]|uniref:putative glutathione-specific gamma-glutamylcyclotransferase 2 n=1 Tax=Microplitis mediator TaxID=375433 RepID=UPI002554AABB|nr:putative glutathione-specific gamma-glutamylcyclotransferase 2 [Microplitis mediator]